MSPLKILLGLSTALVGIVLGGSLLLPTEYKVSRTIQVQAPAEKVYAHLDSPAGWAQWGVWYRKDPQMKVTPSGPAQGSGATWSWTSESQGNGRMKLTAAEPGRGVAYELQIDDFDPSRGAIELSADGTGTRVVWTMEGQVKSPVARWFGFFMDKLVGPDFEAGLANLKQLAEKQ